jgi:aminoglycoside phosphotransferase (APT) family kinase protein
MATSCEAREDDGKPPILDSAAVAASLSRQRGEPISEAELGDICDISQGLSRSRVFAVQLRRPGAAGRFILKIPDWGQQSRLHVADALIDQRERLVIKNGLLEMLPAPLVGPAVFGHESVDGATWIWMEDQSSALNVNWSVAAALAATRAAAAMHSAYRVHAQTLDRLDWLAREPHRLFERHLSEARENLARLARAPKLSPWLSAHSIAGLQKCLDAYEWALARMRLLPVSLAHCDFHPKNLGFLTDGRLLLIDWAQVGLAPPGADVAIFLSLYRLFGNTAEQRSVEFENRLILAYHEGLAASDDSRPPTYADVAQAIWLWTATWGLHLRLGPGLSTVLGGKIKDSNALAATIVDIVDGCDRVLEQADRYMPGRAS